MREDILQLFEEIIVVGKAQLAAIKGRDLARAFELDRHRSALIEMLRELEKNSESFTDGGPRSQNSFLLGTGKAKVGSLVESIIIINREISENIKKQMKDIMEELNGIRKLKRAFCPPIFSRTTGKNISINA